MGLADTFQQIVDPLPEDWTDLEFDLRIADESRYVDAINVAVAGEVALVSGWCRLLAA